jgi:outer membrane receptor protein involved in Fe transport
MPAYNTFDVGVSIAPNDTFELDFTGTNVFNELGITEGNTRVLGSGVNGLGVFLGRPLFGATYEVSGVVRF